MSDYTVQDPLGNRVTLSDDTWRRHITVGHPEMGRYRAPVEQAMSAPLEVRASASDAACVVYMGTLPGRALLVAVVADVRLGIVKTAYPCKSPPKGAILWQQ